MKMLKATLAIATLLSFSVNALAAVEVDDTGSVSASATIVGAASITSVTPGSVTYGTVGTNSFPNEGGIVVSYNSNHDPWKIAIYTNNTNVPGYAAGGRYAKGGLAKTDGSNVVPMKWICQDDATAAPLIGGIASYNYVKDKRDEDDPATGAFDESWATAFADGYANIAFGGASYGWCVDPAQGDFTGDEADGTIAVYVAALFSDVSPSAGTYSATIYFDLYHE